MKKERTIVFILIALIAVGAVLLVLKIAGVNSEVLAKTQANERGTVITQNGEMILPAKETTIVNDKTVICSGGSEPVTSSENEGKMPANDDKTENENKIDEQREIEMLAAGIALIREELEELRNESSCSDENNTTFLIEKIDSVCSELSGSGESLREVLSEDIRNEQTERKAEIQELSLRTIGEFENLTNELVIIKEKLLRIDEEDERKKAQTEADLLLVKEELTALVDSKLNYVSGALSGLLGRLNDYIESNNARVSALEGSVSRINADIEMLRNNMNEFQRQTESSTGAFLTTLAEGAGNTEMLNARVTSFAATVRGALSLYGQIPELSTRIDDLTLYLENYENTVSAYLDGSGSTDVATLLNARAKENDMSAYIQTELMSIADMAETIRSANALQSESTQMRTEIQRVRNELESSFESAIEEVSEANKTQNEITDSRLEAIEKKLEIAIVRGFVIDVGMWQPDEETSRYYYEIVNEGFTENSHVSVNYKEMPGGKPTYSGGNGKMRIWLNEPESIQISEIIIYNC